jgi:DNA-binding NarL/FixJ family response regulator
VRAAELVPGDTVATRTRTATVVRVAPHARPEVVYNLRVERTARYLVGACGAVVHNSESPCAKAAREAVEGIYEFTATSGKRYVGQSSDVERRLMQHRASGKLAAEETVQVTPVNGGKTAREIAEQLQIRKLGGIESGQLENKVNPIGPKRRHLLPPDDD